jgi:hypothetical protein
VGRLSRSEDYLSAASTDASQGRMPCSLNWDSAAANPLTRSVLAHNERATDVVAVAHKRQMLQHFKA